MERSDESWVQEALRDANAFAEIVNRYQKRLYALAYRMLGSSVEAEDATQEAFLRAYRALHSFRTDAAFAPWIYRIATNVCLDVLRARRPVSSTDESPVDPPAHVSVEGSVVERERIHALSNAVQQLPAGLRTVFLLRHESDLSYEEIADTLGIPLNTVRTRLFRARNALRELMKDWL
jgi:RNA polymerase sigma-70 factor (ECF subfamily)